VPLWPPGPTVLKGMEVGPRAFSDSDICYHPRLTLGMLVELNRGDRMRTEALLGPRRWISRAGLRWGALRPRTGPAGAQARIVDPLTRRFWQWPALGSATAFSMWMRSRLDHTLLLADMVGEHGRSGGIAEAIVVATSRSRDPGNISYAQGESGSDAFDARFDAVGSLEGLMAQSDPAASLAGVAAHSRAGGSCLSTRSAPTRSPRALPCPASIK